MIARQDLALIDDIVIDCLIGDDHQLESEVSEFPVEEGEDITDNIRPKNIVVTIEAIVSNSPLTSVEEIEAFTVPPADLAYVRLQQIRNARQPVMIRTSLDTYENMVLKSLGIPRTIANGDALQFTATFQQMEIVENTRGPRVAIPGGLGDSNKNKGPKKSDLVTRMVDPYDGTWFDPDINGWREGASYNTQKGHWEFFKGRPLHENQSGWQSGDPNHHLTDQEYKEKNETGLVPGVDKKTGKVNKNAAQQFMLITDPASIDAARKAGALDAFGNPLP